MAAQRAAAQNPAGARLALGGAAVAPARLSHQACSSGWRTVDWRRRWPRLKTSRI